MCYGSGCKHELWSGECDGLYVVCPMNGEEETADGNAIIELYKDGEITLKEARRLMGMRV